MTQPVLATAAHDAKEHVEVYPFPPPAQLHVATLGWDAAAVDLIWSDLLVEYGTHWQQHREMTDIPNYVNAIIALDPKFAPIYHYVDTLLAYRPLLGTEADVRLARAYLERGKAELPDDVKTWMEYGEFLAFIAPSFLHDPAEVDRWRRDGAEGIAHAVLLGADAERALTAATLLTQAGQSDEAVDYLERAYAFTEHPSMRAIHDAIGKRLAALQSTRIADEADRAARAVDERWQQEWPFLDRDHYLLLGPRPDAARCAGVAASDDPSCGRDWDAIVGGAGAGAP
jgi:tetratricopeptide (TPR) repeat protein